MAANELIGVLAVLLATGAVAGIEVLLVADFLIEKVTRRPRGRITRRLRLPWTVLSLGVLGCLVYAHWVEPFRFEVTRHTVSAASLPHGFHLRILQLTDLHLEGDGPAADWIVRTVEAEKPDVIALTGDYINNFDAGKEALRGVLSRLSAPDGILAVTGNYDGFDPAEVSKQSFTLHGFARDVSRNGRHVSFFGCDLVGPGEFAGYMKKLPPSDFTVVLYHTPEMIDEAAAKGADLYLCGHTHGGQVRLPFYGAVVTLSDTGKKYEAGEYEVGKMTAYVCRGIGTEGGLAPRLRFLCRPEIAVFDVVGTAK